MSPLNAAVIGLAMGAHHARAYAGRAQTDLIALCDPDGDRLNALGDELGIQLRFTAHRDLLEVRNLNICSVCSPDHFHASQTLELLAAGVHVSCERPMAPSIEQCRSMVLAARKARRTLMVSQSYRVPERFRAIESIVAQGHLGQLCLVQSEPWWRRHGPEVRWCRGICRQRSCTGRTVYQQRAKTLRQAFTWSPSLPMVQPEVPQAASCRRFSGTRPWYRGSWCHGSDASCHVTTRTAHATAHPGRRR